MNKSRSIFRRLVNVLTAAPPFDPGVNQFFVEDQPVEPTLPLGYLVKESPLFVFYLRRIHWLRDGEQAVHRFQVIALIAALGIFLMGGVGSYALHSRSVVYGFQGTSWSGLLQLVTDSSLCLLIGSIPLAMLSDVLCMVAGQRWIRRRDPFFELLRLSPLSKRGILVSYHAAIRFSAWRLMTVVAALRIVGMVGLLIAAFVLIPLTQNLNLVSVFTGIIQLEVAFYVSLMFVMESRWHLIMVALRALTVGIRDQSASANEVFAFLNLVAFWIERGFTAVVVAGICAVAGSIPGIVLFGIGFWLSDLTVAYILVSICGVVVVASLLFGIFVMVRGYHGLTIRRELRESEFAAFAFEPDQP